MPSVLRVEAGREASRAVFPLFIYQVRINSTFLFGIYTIKVQPFFSPHSFRFEDFETILFRSQSQGLAHVLFFLLFPFALHCCCCCFCCRFYFGLVHVFFLVFSVFFPICFSLSSFCSCSFSFRLPALPHPPCKQCLPGWCKIPTCSVPAF